MVFNKKIIGIGFLIFFSGLVLWDILELQKDKAPSTISGGENLGKLTDHNFFTPTKATWEDNKGNKYPAKIINIHQSNFPWFHGSWYYKPFYNLNYWHIIQNKYINPTYKTDPQYFGSLTYGSSGGSMNAG